MYTVLGNIGSRTSRVIWMLEEIGAPYTHQPASPQSDEVRALSPLGKIPILLDGAHTITDSTAILTYLGDKHAALTYPAGTPERALQDGHTNFLLDEFDACLWAALRHKFVLPKERRLAGLKETLNWEFSRSQKHFVARLGAHPFLMGSQITVPDIIVTH
ncbi:MAG: glutathione S-transferase family protein, partial [Paracoccaceae bacterium]